MSELESLRALDSAIEYLTGEYDEEFPMVAGLISLRASLASMTQERNEWEAKFYDAATNSTDHEGELAALTQERDALQRENDAMQNVTGESVARAWYEHQGYNEAEIEALMFE